MTILFCAKKAEKNERLDNAVVELIRKSRLHSPLIVKVLGSSHSHGSSLLRYGLAKIVCMQNIHTTNNKINCYKAYVYVWCCATSGWLSSDSIYVHRFQCIYFILYIIDRSFHSLFLSRLVHKQNTFYSG